MTQIIEFENYCDLEDKVDKLYDTFNHVEFVKEAGMNKAEYFCTM